MKWLQICLHKTYNLYKVFIDPLGSYGYAY
jgi:hypothetical protein